MKKKLGMIVRFFLCLALVFAFAGCKKDQGTENQGEPDNSDQKELVKQEENSSEDSGLADEQVFRYYTRNDPETLDPWMNDSGDVEVIVAALHEPLLRPSNSELGYEPGLATEYKANDDKTVHTFSLRQDAKWQDGTLITAEDVVNSFYRVLDPELGSARAYRYFPIKNAEAVYNGEVAKEELGVKVVDESTIEITTEEPCDYFVDMISGSGFAPIQKAAADEFGDLYGTDADKVVSSGPFVITEWVRKNEIVLEKNPNYWDTDSVYLDKIFITITSDKNTIMGMYESDELSLMRVSYDQIEKYKAEPGFVKMPRLRVSFIEFNPSNEFLGNDKIRQALSIAFDRKAFAKNVIQNEELAAYGLVPYGVTGLDGGDFREQAGQIVKDASDPAAIEDAKRLLQEGLDELGKTIEEMQDGFSIQCLDSGKVQAQAIQGMWKSNLDLEMPVSVLDFNVILPMLQNGTFDCVIGGGQSSSYRDPEAFMQFIYNENKWDSAEFKELVEKAHSQTGNDRIQTWMDIERLVLDNFIYIPQVYSENLWVIKDNVKDLRVYSYGTEFDFKYAKILK